MDIVFALQWALFYDKFSKRSL